MSPREVVESGWFRVDGPLDDQSCEGCRTRIGKVIRPEEQAVYQEYHAARDHACRCRLHSVRVHLKSPDPGSVGASRLGILVEAPDFRLRHPSLIGSHTLGVLEMPERAAKQERSIAYPPDDLVQRLDRVQAVGHEIREALTPLMLRAHAVLEDVPAERRASAEAVERSLARARTLLDQLHEEVLEARRLAAAGARGLFPPG